MREIIRVINNEINTFVYIIRWNEIKKKWL